MPPEIWKGGRYAYLSVFEECFPPFRNVQAITPSNKVKSVPIITKKPLSRRSIMSKRISFMLAVHCCGFLFLFLVAAQTAHSAQIRFSGFLDYEGGYSTKTGQNFYKSNTSVYSQNDKTRFSSRAQVRIAARITNPNAHLTSNLTIQSWPGSFNLWRAYIKHALAKG